MTTTEFITFVGVLFSLGLGVWNLSHSKRTQYINTVTSERVKWIQELRKNISTLIGAVHTWTHTYAHAIDPLQREGERELLQEIDRLTYLVRLQLNPKDEPDAEIEKLILAIPKLTNRATLDPLHEVLERITRKAQQLLKNEWEKVKAEAAPKFFPDEYTL